MLGSSLGGLLARRHRRRRGGDDGLGLWPEMAELGLLGLTVPEAGGGGGLGPSAVAAVGRILGEQLVPEPFAACAVMPAAVVAALAAGDVRDDLRDALIGGRERICLAWQTAANQTAAFPADCRIDADGRLIGVKRFVVAPDRQALVTAMGADGPCIVLADLAGPGVEVETQPTSDGAAYATLRFKGAVVASPLITGAEAEAAMTTAFDHGLLAAAAQLAGLTEGVLTLTLEHLRTRVQFERPIGSFQALQHRAVEMRIRLALADASVREAARMLEAEPGSPQASAAASAAKASASAAALAVCKEAIQMHGAIAFTEESDVGLFARAALKWSSWLGGAREHRRRFVALDGELIHGR